MNNNDKTISERFENILGPIANKISQNIYHVYP